jgi:hypothetical protein
MTLNAQQLSEHRWENRLIVLVGSGESAALLDEQIALLMEHRDVLEDLKLLVYQFKEAVYSLGLCAEEGWQAGTVPAYLAREIPKNTPFSFFLIGLDGGVKMRRNDVVPIADIYELIDQMPMRRAELNRQHE